MTWTAAEAWLRFALQDLVQIAVEDVQEPSDRLAGAIHRAKEALVLSDKEAQRERTSP